MPKKLYENGPPTASTPAATPSGRPPHRGGVHASEWEMWTGTGEAKNLAAISGKKEKGKHYRGGGGR